MESGMGGESGKVGQRGVCKGAGVGHGEGVMRRIWRSIRMGATRLLRGRG